MRTGREMGRHREMKEQSFRTKGLGGPEKALVILTLQTEQFYHWQGKILKRDKHVMCAGKRFEVLRLETECDELPKGKTK